MKKRWNHPSDWLLEASEGWTEGELRREFLNLVEKLSEDQIQDLYQQDMEYDGYFGAVVEAERP